MFDVLNVGRPGFQVPLLEYPKHLSPDILILRKEFAWHIGGALSQQESEEWKLLYHSTIHGLSFNTFLGNLSYVFSLNVPTCKTCTEFDFITHRHA